MPREKKSYITKSEVYLKKVAFCIIKLNVATDVFQAKPPSR